MSDKNWIYYLEKEFSFFRISFPLTKSNFMVPKGTSSVSAEISYGNENPLPESRNDLTNRVIDDLKRAEILLKNDEILFSDTIDIKYGYVIYDKERKGAVDIIHSFLRNKDIIPCGRYGDWAYHWSDDAILSGKNAAEVITQKCP